ncbi:MAG TPA: alpha/beta hydrolase-fold protein, partial [Acidimicrobiales bacterium]|nr:alpha/beta hydrolase-fold protein [Acidimicrobiales bacterium]
MLSDRGWKISVGVIALALAASGLAGAFQYGWTFWLYRGFPPPSVSVKLQHGTLLEFPLVSAALGGRSEPVYVFLPPGYAENPKERYPALYLLHGTPGRPLNFIQVGDLGVLEDTLVAEHRIHPMVLVMPEGAFGLFGDTEWANSVRPGNDWESWVTEDVVTAVDGRFRVATSADARGIAGLSEGGYGALNIGIHHLDEFHLIESWSGYMGADNIKAIFGGEPSLLRYNSPAITVKAVAPVMRKDGDFIWFYCGSRDGSILGQNYRFASELAMLG